MGRVDTPERGPVTSRVLSTPRCGAHFPDPTGVMEPDHSPPEEITRFEEQYRVNPDSLVFARLADAYRKAGDLERALAVLDDGLRRHPEYATGHIVRGRVLRDLGRADGAMAAFRRVLDLDGQNLVAVRELGALALGRGDGERARHWYERLALLDPSNPEARQRLADLGEAVAEETRARPAAPSDRAEPDREATEEASPEDPTGAVEAILNGEVEEPARADDTWWYEERSADTGAESSRDADLLTRTMAELYAEQGLYREAEEIYSELLREAPEDFDLQARLAEVRRAVARRGRSPSTAPPGTVETAPEVPEQPRGRPVADEIRRLLRSGEALARELGEPAVLAGQASPAAEADTALEAGEEELPVSSGEEAAVATDQHPRPDARQPLSEFALRWIRALTESE